MCIKYKFIRFDGFALQQYFPLLLSYKNQRCQKEQGRQLYSQVKAQTTEPFMQLQTNQHIDNGITAVFLNVNRTKTKGYCIEMHEVARRIL